MDRWANLIIPDPAGLASDQDHRCRFTLTWVFTHKQDESSERKPAAQVNGVVQFSNDDIIVYLIIIKQFDQLSGCHDLFAEQLLDCLTQHTDGAICLCSCPQLFQELRISI